MGQINLKIDNNLEHEFRMAAVERFEAKKGFLKKAVEEALREWVLKQSKGKKHA